MTPERVGVGAYLRRCRDALRLSLDDVAELTAGYPERITKSHLSRIENAKAFPTFGKMCALSDIYGVPIAEIAEQFELDLRRRMHPEIDGDKTERELLQDCRTLKISGRYAEALLIYEALIRRREDGAQGETELVDIQFGLISCLIHIARFSAAKEECGKVLDSSTLTPFQRVKALELYSICCYRLGSFTIALITLREAETKLETLDSVGDLAAHLAMLKGNLAAVTGAAGDAIEAYARATSAYEELGIPFEACRARLNLASAYIEVGNLKLARSHLRKVRAQAEAQSYDRQHALALSNLALIAYRDGDLAAAETYCVRSNRLARPREYISVIFRNCFYLHRIAEAKGDEAQAKANARALRAYLGRVEEFLPEAEEFRSTLMRGKS